MKKNNLIFTFSGIRGIFDKDLDFRISKKLAIAFGMWYNGTNKRVIIGKDTRPSGNLLEKGVVEGLISTGFDIVNVGVCASPIIIHAKNSLETDEIVIKCQCTQCL